MTVRDTVKPLAFLMALVLIWFIGSCVVLRGKNAQVITETTEPIVRVLMHRAKEFTFLVPVPDSHELVSKHVEDWGADIHFFRDVPADQEMFVKYFTDLNGDLKKLEIHIHAATDINGAGWNAGKFGSGTTTVIQ